MSDDELKRLLRQNLDLARENNKMLRAMRRDALFGKIFKLLWIAFIIGVPVYLYFSFIEPTFEQLGSTLDEVQSGVETGKDSVQSVIDKIPFLDTGEETP